jgi:hypothetical protein
MKWKHKLLSLIFLIVLTGLGAGCDRPASPGGTDVWIDVPVSGRTVPENTSLEINGHAASREGVSRVEIWINGDLQYELTGLSTVDELSRFSQPWTPPGPGEYTIQVLAIGNDGTPSEPDVTRIQVGGGEMEEAQPEEEAEVPDAPTLTPTFTPTPTATPTTAPEVVIDFWAEPSTVQAGSAVTIFWHVENVQTVIFGGVQQAFDGSYTDTLCEDAVYRLTVVHQDGTDEERVLSVDVQGTCATPTFTPTPEEDKTPPTAPALLKPQDGVDLGCVSSAMLRWQPVSDESGIAEYQVELQRHPGDENWEHVPGSRFTGINDDELEVSLGCGYYYRWRVRAIDGNNNTGDWSSWFTFTVPLG